MSKTDEYLKAVADNLASIDWIPADPLDVEGIEEDDNLDLWGDE